MTNQLAQKSPTLQDVARAAGISKATASLALNGDSRISPQTRDVVLEAARTLRYRANPIARSLSRGWRDTMVGLFTMGLDLGSRTRSVKLIQQSLNARGFEVPVHVYGAPHTAAGVADGSGTSMRNLCAQRPRAIVCNTSSDLAPDVAEELHSYRERGGIVVCYDHDPGLGCDQVLFDREAYTYHSAAHLLGLGHHRLALGPSGTITPNHPWAKGFLRAHADFGVAPWSGWLLNGGTYEEGGVLLADQFLALWERPTGLCIINDQSASAFLNRVIQNGLRAPQDVSVVGHDDSPAAAAAIVPLTTVRRPVEEIAAAVVELLTARLDRADGEAQVVRFSGTLVTRSSTAPHTRKETYKGGAGG